MADEAAEVEAVEGVEVPEAEVLKTSPTEVETRVVAETPEQAVAAAEADPRLREGPNRHTPATRRPDMLTCPHSQPAGATGPMGKVLTIVKNPQPVPGKTFGFPNQIWNEVPTSSIIRMTTDRYIICCTEMTWK